jgi:serine/threonine protein kinase
MGAVYAAFDEKLERYVALKVLIEKPTDPQQRKRFFREARLAAKLTHPNIATVYEVDEIDGQLVIVMELLEGDSMRAIMSRRRLTVDEAVAIGRDVARALARAHQAGVTHRDVKPENVFLTQPSPGSLLAKVLDFGLARERAPRQPGEEHTATDTTSAGAMWGTPGYLSPEQAHGKSADTRSDVFSFGALFYEMLAGRRAFHGDNPVTLLLAVAKREPEPVRSFVPNLRPEVEEIVVRCLKKNPDDRFADGTELATALDAFDRVSGQPLIATGPASDADADVPTAPHSNPDLAEVAQTLRTDLEAVKSMPLTPTRELPLLEQLKRKNIQPVVAITMAAAGVVFFFLIVASISSSRRTATAAPSEPPALFEMQPPPVATAPPAPDIVIVELGASPSASAARSAAPPHPARPRATSPKP